MAVDQFPKPQSSTLFSPVLPLSYQQTAWRTRYFEKRAELGLDSNAIQPTAPHVPTSRFDYLNVPPPLGNPSVLSLSRVAGVPGQWPTPSSDCSSLPDSTGLSNNPGIIDVDSIPLPKAHRKRKRRVVKGQVEGSGGARQWKCECGDEMRYDNRIRHLKSTCDYRANKQLHTCGLCGEELSRPDALKRHLEKKVCQKRPQRMNKSRTSPTSAERQSLEPGTPQGQSSNTEGRQRKRRRTNVSMQNEPTMSTMQQPQDTTVPGAAAPNVGLQTIQRTPYIHPETNHSRVVEADLLMVDQVASEFHTPAVPDRQPGLHMPSSSFTDPIIALDDILPGMQDLFPMDFTSQQYLPQEPQPTDAFWGTRQVDCTPAFDNGAVSFGDTAGFIAHYPNATPSSQTLVGSEFDYMFNL